MDAPRKDTLQNESPPGEVIQPEGSPVPRSGTALDDATPPASGASEPDELDLKTPELSTRVVRSLTLYFEERFGAAALDAVLQETGLPREYLQDEHNWVSLKYLERLLQVTTEHSHDPKFAFKAGLSTVNPNVIGVGYSILAGISSPRYLYRKLIELSPHYNRVGEFSVVELTHTSLTLLYLPKSEAYMDGELGNEFRMGQFVAWPRLANLPDANYTYEVTKVGDRPGYRYVFTWHTRPFPLDPVIGGIVGALASFPVLGWFPQFSSLGLSLMLGFIGLLSGLQVFNYRRMRRLSASLAQQQNFVYSVNFRLQEQIAALHGALTEEKNLQRQLAEKVKELNISYGQLEISNAQLEISNSRLEISNSQLEISNAQLEQSKSALEQSHAELTVRNQKLHDQNEELKATARLREQNQQMIKQLDEERELKDVKTRFFARINHELRNPLTFMLPTVEMLVHASIEEESLRNYRQTFRDMQDNTRRLLKLINELLELSKIDVKQLRIPYESADINRLVEHVVSMVPSTANGHSLHVKLELAPSLPRVTVGVEKIDGAILNLLSNAYKFTPEGGTIYVSTGYENGQVFIRVRDTGPGIPSERLPILFDRFNSVGTKMTRGYGSAGLGLSLVKEYIETLHHGRVEVSSAPGQGATFTLWLPEGEGAMREELAERRRQTVSAALPLERRRGNSVRVAIGEVLKQPSELTQVAFHEYEVAQRSGGPPHVEGRATILVVDDDPMIVDVISGLIYKTYNVIKAYNRLEGEAKARVHLPALIISDLQMAEESEAGFDLCVNLKNDERLRDTPIILLTAHTDAGVDGARLESKGADDYIYKPFTAHQLLGRIRLHLERASKKQEIVRQNELLEQQKLTLERMAKTDALTNVYNRRYLEEAGREAFKKAKEEGQSLACIMLDIDHFKRFNTQYGHTGGDIVLKEMGKILQEFFSERGVVARYGGEEFAVLLPTYERESAYALAEAFRQTVDETRFDPEYQFHITVSMGVAVYPDHACESHEKLLTLADDALFTAKITRNQVKVAEVSASTPATETTTDATKVDTDRITA